MSYKNWWLDLKGVLQVLALESVAGNNTKAINEEVIATLSSCYGCIFSWPSMLHISISSILFQIYVPRTSKITNIFILRVKFFFQLTEGHCGFFPHVHCMFLPYSAVVYRSTKQTSNNEWNNTGNRDYDGCDGSKIPFPWILWLPLLQSPTDHGKLDSEQ